MGSSGKRKDEKRSRKKSKRRKKDKNHRRKRRSVSPTSSSDDDNALPDQATQLAMGRTAARAIREILAYNYELRGELRQLASHLDSDNALDISGLPDPFLLSRLRTLLDNVPLLRRSSAGHYLHRQSAPLVLPFLAPFLEETPESLTPYAQAAIEFEKARNTASERQVPIETRNPGAEPRLPNAGETLTAQEHGIAEARRVAGPTMPPAGWQPQQVEEGEERRPQGGAPQQPLDDDVGSPAETLQDEGKCCRGIDAAADNPSSMPQVRRRVLGPAMPPPEMLAAAADLGSGPVHDENASAKGAKEYCGDIEDDGEGLIGPPPPEFQAEADLASMDERSAEVARVIHVLRAHESSPATLLQPGTAPGAAPTPQPPDPYDVLGISQSLSASDIKKHYWKLSLRIHPDKCAHPEAPKAFQAVAAAAAELQDATRRAAADERRKDSALRKEFAEFAAQQERDRQWRMARGEATAEDISGVSEKFQPRAAQRESWMTDLPPERRAAAPSPGKNQAAFQTTRPRDATSDRSAWTLTPQQRAAEAARITSGGGAHGSEPLKIAPGGAFSSSRNVEARKTTTTAPTQRKSLMEQHLERQVAAATAAQRDRQGKKRKKKASNDKGGEDGPKSGDPDWDRSAHPWRPFDREKDLNVRSTSDKNDPQALLKNLPGLKSKFARGGA